MSDMPQDHHAAYIAENFGIPFAAALKITQRQAKKSIKQKAKAAAKSKAKSRR